MLREWAWVAENLRGNTITPDGWLAMDAFDRMVIAEAVNDSVKRWNEHLET